MTREDDFLMDFPDSRISSLSTTGSHVYHIEDGSTDTILPISEKDIILVRAENDLVPTRIVRGTQYFVRKDDLDPSYFATPSSYMVNKDNEAGSIDFQHIISAYGLGKLSQALIDIGFSVRRYAEFFDLTHNPYTINTFTHVLKSRAVSFA